MPVLPLQSPAIRVSACLLALLAGTTSGASGSARGAVESALAGQQATESLTIQAAPVRIEAPEGRGQWLRRLALFADSAAQAYADILGAPVPAGTLRWQPDPLAARQIDAAITVSRGGDGTTMSFDEPFAILAEDLGVAFAQGYARWITAYSLARLYFADAEDPNAWWVDGAALYMTELLARRERSTTPVLYNLEAAYSRAVRSSADVPLEGAGREAAGDAARGKSLATFRLLEALYGEAAVNDLLLAAANAPAAADLRETAVGNLPADLVPAPGALLDAWMQPRAAVDIGIADVDLRGGGRQIRGRVTRSGDVPVSTQVEVTLADGSRLYADVPAGTDDHDWELEVGDQPVDVRVDRDALLPDVNRSNNRYRFGDADRIREFFPLDEQIEIGELHFDGDIQQVGRKRAENFSVTLRNLTDEAYGLGLLVSAQWVDRPAARTQRRIFIVLPAGETVVARDFIEYPRRGRGRARIEARYWSAADPDVLTERLLRDPADLLNSYLILREPAEATGPDGSPLERLEAQRIESVAELAVAGAGNSGIGNVGGEGPPTASPTPAQDAPETAPGDLFGVRIISPTVNATPLGEMTFTVAVDGPPAGLIELYVNNEVVGRGDGSAARATFTATNEQNIYLLQAMAVGVDGELASDTRLLQRGAIGFGASVDLVTLNLTVRQPGGGFVEDLTAEDFVIIEDGVTQEVVNFAKGEDTAVSAAMLLDTSSSMIGGGINSARAGAKRLVDSLLRGNDRAMVLGFNDRVYLYADFTNDVAALDAAIDATHPDGSTSLYDAVVESLRKVNRNTGRRALIVLSDGLDVESQFSFADVLEYTRQSDVLVYTIGLQLMHDATDLGDASDAVRGSVEALQELAEITGGSAYFPLSLDELEGIYAEIAAELESQYSVSYYPTNQQWDGEWRRLDVSLERRSGSVQARPGYYGVRPGDRQR